jgi:nitrile hydratase
MDGIHDLGGMQGFGAVEREADEPAFHARWEAAVFAMVFAASRNGLTGNADRFRHAIERNDPVAYLTQGYYGRWLGGLETLLVESGLLRREEISARARALGAGPDDRIASRPAAHPDAVPPAEDPGCRRPLAVPPRFALGDRVRTRLEAPDGHTRLPHYARGRSGRIQGWHDGWVFPDTHAHGRGEQPQHLYSVAFRGEDLWGAEAEPNSVVHLDLFEPYLEPAHEP